MALQPASIGKKLITLTLKGSWSLEAIFFKKDFFSFSSEKLTDIREPAEFFFFYAENKKSKCDYFKKSKYMVPPNSW